jgi:hypothetical protein
LGGEHLFCLRSFSLFDGFSNAVDDVQSFVKRNNCFFGNVNVRFFQLWDVSSFAVSKNDPFEAKVCNVVGADFTCVSTETKLADILYSNLGMVGDSGLHLC